MFYRTLLLLSIYTFQVIQCIEEPSNVFLTAAKSIPRIGRSNKEPTDFEKFFLKASKSVPRIGRRNENPFLRYDEIEKESTQPNVFKYPAWSEIADRYEHNPELFSNPHIIYELEKNMGDDPTIYELNKVRMKRKISDNDNEKTLNSHM